MQFSKLLTSITHKFLYLVLIAILIIFAIFFIWQKNKFSFVKKKLSEEFITRSDSIYTIQYDSLYFDELRGEAFIKNIRITPDTARIKNKDPRNIPYVLLNISIRSITVNGVKTEKAFSGEEMVGDSIIIDEPKITAYFLKSIKKQTKIDLEAKEVYRQILGKIKLIQVAEVIIKNAEVHAVNFSNQNRQFDVLNTTIRLHDVKIDSMHNEDTSRILFCKDATFGVDEFTAYNNNRPELTVKGIAFNGKEKQLSFSAILFNRFADSTAATGVKLVEAQKMIVTGINTYEIVKNKNIYVDSILCQHIAFYRPPALSLTPKPMIKEEVTPKDTAGFRSVYGVEVNNLYFPDIDVIEINPPASQTNFKLGKFALKLKSIEANPLLNIETDPISHAKEADLHCNNIFYNSPDNLYHYHLENIGYNSLHKQFYIGSFSITPSYSEVLFAQKTVVQKDRYDVGLQGISIREIDLDRLLKKELYGNSVTVSSGSIKIYRDISRRLEPKSKVGHYPHEMLMKADLPIDLRHATFNNAYIEYKEKNTQSGNPGTVKFERSKIDIDNITNVPSSLQRNNVSTVTFHTNILGALPADLTLKFFLGAKDGKFSANGNFGSCDATILNSISVPMALINIDGGNIDNAEFSFTGNDVETNGDLTMRYSGLKLALMKKDEETKALKKRTIMSALANTIIRNSNPANDKLRSITVHYDRDPLKSFFNLIWKTIFTGIQGTIGIPMPKIKEPK